MAIATELAEASVHGDPVAFLGNVCRTQHALAKACATTSGRPLNIVVLGHSLPGGRHVQRRERWSEQLWGALNASWPARCGRPVVTNLALGGTKIDYIVAAHAGLLEQGLAAADVVLVDYARYQPAGGSDLDVPATEEAGLSEAMVQAQAEAAVLRLLELPRRPALLFALHWWQQVGSCAGSPADHPLYAPVAHHNVTVLSYQAAACIAPPGLRAPHLNWLTAHGNGAEHAAIPAARQAKTLTSARTARAEGLHPQASTHRLIGLQMASWMLHSLNTAIAEPSDHQRCGGAEAEAEAARRRSPLSSSHLLHQINTALCASYPPLTDLSFDRGRGFAAVLARGWRVYEDRPGKLGWIAQLPRKPRSDSSPPPRLSLRVDVSVDEAQLTIGYLRSYSGFGKARLWIDDDEDHAVTLNGHWTDRVSQTEHVTLAVEQLCGASCWRVIDARLDAVLAGSSSNYSSSARAPPTTLGYLLKHAAARGVVAAPGYILEDEAKHRVASQQDKQAKLTVRVLDELMPPRRCDDTSRGGRCGGDPFGGGSPALARELLKGRGRAMAQRLHVTPHVLTLEAVPDDDREQQPPPPRRFKLLSLSACVRTSLHDAGYVRVQAFSACRSPSGVRCLCGSPYCSAELQAAV